MSGQIVPMPDPEAKGDQKIVGSSHSEWLTVDDLHVDESYQRGLNQNHVARIAREFDPNLLGAIDVAKRADGTYFVVDGQHRVMAMRQRGYGSMRTLCNVWLSDGGLFEARVFIGKNDGRKTVPAYSRYKAKVRGEMSDEIAVSRMLSDLSIPVVESHGKGHGWHGEAGLWAIGTVVDLYGKAPRLTRDAMTVLRDAWTDHPRAYEANIIKGTAAFLAEHAGEIELGDVAAALKVDNPDDILDYAAQCKSNKAHPLSCFVAQGIADSYNRTRRGRQVKLAARLAKTYGLAVRNYCYRTPENVR